MKKIIQISLLSLSILALNACSFYSSNDNYKESLSSLPEYKTSPTNLNNNTFSENKNIYFDDPDLYYSEQYQKYGYEIDKK